MPTGYTASVATGETATFRDFAIKCARAFGALIHMRDDNAGAEIRPQVVSSYHADAIVTAKAEVIRLGALSPKQCQAEADKAFAARVAARNERNAETAAQKARYENMLASVRAWNPPTADHQHMKKFMADQLEESIKFDCSTYDEPAEEPQSGEQWYWQQISQLSKSIAYHEKRQAEEVAQAEKNNRWVEELRKSLPAA